MTLSFEDKTVDKGQKLGQNGGFINIININFYYLLLLSEKTNLESSVILFTKFSILIRIQKF